jgi:hypothetical protein
MITVTYLTGSHGARDMDFDTRQAADQWCVDMRRLAAASEEMDFEVLSIVSTGVAALNRIFGWTMDYDTFLADQFGALQIDLVRHDTSPGGCPTKIVVRLGATPKDKGTTAMDLSNYLYRMGLKFQTVPEYLGRGKTTTLTFYMSWNDIRPILGQLGTQEAAGDHIPFDFRSILIQNADHPAKRA